MMSWLRTLPRRVSADEMLRFADAWVRHSAQTATIRDREALRCWVLWHWGGWAWKRYRAHPYRPEQLVDMARAITKA